MMYPIYSLVLVASLFIGPSLCDVLDLTKLGAEGFNSKVQSFDLILVKFFAPWCGHCKQLAPEYERAAKELETHKDGPIPLAEVNCDSGAGREICASLDISSFPTLVLFKHGNRVKNYKGERTAKEIKRFMEGTRMLMSPSKRFHTFKEFLDSRTERHNTNRVHLIGLFKSHKDELLQEFHKAAEKERWGIEFMHTFISESKPESVDLLQELSTFTKWDNSELPEEYSKWIGDKDKWGADEGERRQLTMDDLPAVLLFRPDMYHHVTHDPHLRYNATIKGNSLRKWIKKNFVGLVGYRDYISEESWQKPLFVAYYKVDFVNHTEVTNKWRGVLAPIARKWHPRYQFAVSDWNKYRHDLREVQLIPPEPNVTDLMPIMIGYQRTGMRYLMYAPFAPEHIDKFVTEFRDGKIRPYLKSSNPPEENDQRVVKEVVGKTFWSLVVDHERDVFLILYDPKCPYCKRILPHWQKLGQLLSDDKHIDILQMDVIHNEIPHPYEAPIYPTIYWIPAKDRDHPRKYDGGRDFNSFISFLAQYSSSRLKNYDRDGDDPKEYTLGFKAKYDL